MCGGDADLAPRFGLAGCAERFVTLARLYLMRGAAKKALGVLQRAVHLLPCTKHGQASVSTNGGSVSGAGMLGPVERGGWLANERECARARKLRIRIRSAMALISGRFPC